MALIFCVKTHWLCIKIHVCWKHVSLNSMWTKLHLVLADSIIYELHCAGHKPNQMKNKKVLAACTLPKVSSKRISIFCVFFHAFLQFALQPSKHTETQMQPAMAEPRQVVRAWVVWVRDIHPGWRRLGAKMDHRSWHSNSCGPDLLPWSGNKQKKERREAHYAAGWFPPTRINRFVVILCSKGLFMLPLPSSSQVMHTLTFLQRPGRWLRSLTSRPRWSFHRLTQDYSPRDSGLTDWFSHSKARGSSVLCMRWQDFQAQAVSPTCFVLLRRISNVTHVMFDWELGRCRRRRRRPEEEERKTYRRRLADDSEKNDAFINGRARVCLRARVLSVDDEADGLHGTISFFAFYTNYLLSLLQLTCHHYCSLLFCLKKKEHLCIP